MGSRKNGGIARRRHEKSRMKRKARQVYPHDEAARLTNHLAVCSGPCCGNPRRHFGERTLQERRADIAARQALEGRD